MVDSLPLASRGEVSRDPRPGTAEHPMPRAITATARATARAAIVLVEGDGALRSAVETWLGTNGQTGECGQPRGRQTWTEVRCQPESHLPPLGVSKL